MRNYGRARRCASRNGISLDANDVVSWPLDDRTFDGMQLRIDQVLHLEQTYTSTISHGTSYCYDANLPTGMEEVITQGVDGEMLCTATVTYVNGVEIKGEMRNNTDYTQVLDASTTFVTLNGAYHEGEVFFCTLHN